MPELKPCPFCGAAMRIERRIYADYAEWLEPRAIYMHDDDCPLSAVLWCMEREDGWTEETVAAAWNRRANDA